tara:strand:- start:349 stop:831 length:483 start_codon:yes stop_codon:yes gene_type:complete
MNILPYIVPLKDFLKSRSSASRNKYMWQISGGLVIALVIVSGAFKLYYDKAEAEKEAIATQLRQSADNQLLLENSIKSLNEQLIRVEEEKAKTFEQINLLQAANAKAQEEVSNLKSKFDKHNMNVLSLRKPKLIENIINRGTREVLSELETITNPTVNNM